MNDLFSRSDLDDARFELAKAAEALPEGWPSDGLRPHPYAGINRMMTPSERTDLRLSIEASGLREKIVMLEGWILDGRNRYLECVATGRFAAHVDWRTHPDFIEFGGPKWDPSRGTDPLSFVWDMDVRRHRAAKDVALAAARFLRFADALHVNAGSGPGQPRAKLPTQAEMAKRYGISERLINSASVLIDRATPELVQAVDEDKVSLTDAAELSKLDKVEQRIIAENPDRKSAKAAVKVAKANKPKKKGNAGSGPGQPRDQQLPLIEPVGRKELAEFAEHVIGLAQAAAKKHGGPGASISADKIIGFAQGAKLIEGEGFSRALLLALGKLRDFEAKPSPKPTHVGQSLPPAPPLGQQVDFPILGLPKGHSAAFAIFHEADDTYSHSLEHSWPTTGGGGPFTGAYPSYEVAIGAAAGAIFDRLNMLAEKGGSLVSERSIAAARKGMAYIDAQLAEWGIEKLAADFRQWQTPSRYGQAEQNSLDAQDNKNAALNAYRVALSAGAEHRGKHTLKTAEPIIRAADTARVKVQQVADDMGHPKGTVGGWRNKLQLQDHDRLLDPARAQHFKGKARAEASA